MDWRRVVEAVEKGEWRMEILSRGDCIVNCVLERFEENGKITNYCTETKEIILEFLNEVMDEVSIFEDNFGIADEHFSVITSDSSIYLVEHPEPYIEGCGCRKEARILIKSTQTLRD